MFARLAAIFGTLGIFAGQFMGGLTQSAGTGVIVSVLWGIIALLGWRAIFKRRRF